MARTPGLPVLLVLVMAASGIAYLVLTAGNPATDREQRRILFQEAAIRAEPLIAAISAYTSASGHPPDSLADIVPQYLELQPGTGLPGCSNFEYRSLSHKPALLVWYDLGSRQGQPLSGPGRYSDGDPDHAILVFTLDSQDKITSAMIDRLPEGREPLDFQTAPWIAGENRIEMALALAETYRLHGMPRTVFEPMLGPPDGSRAVQGAPWELRINCPTGLLNHDAFVYWPTGNYPEHLYGGETEPIGKWVYIHS
jgi:hypothetical protein